MTMHVDETKLSPEGCAESLARQMDEQAPTYWTTEQLGDFWFRMLELVTLHVITLKPELVKPYPPRDVDDDD